MVKIKKQPFTNLSSGVALYLAIIVLAVLTTALLSLLAIVLSQSKAISALSDSVVAFYAADTGIEEALYCIFDEGWSPQIADRGKCLNFSPSPCSPTCASGACVNGLSNGSTYEVCVSPDSQYTIWSTGVYGITTRKIEINF